MTAPATQCPFLLLCSSLHLQCCSTPPPHAASPQGNPRSWERAQQWHRVWPVRTFLIFHESKTRHSSGGQAEPSELADWPLCHISLIPVAVLPQKALLQQHWPKWALQASCTKNMHFCPSPQLSPPQKWFLGHCLLSAPGVMVVRLWNMWLVLMCLFPKSALPDPTVPKSQRPPPVKKACMSFRRQDYFIVTNLPFLSSTSVLRVLSA